MIIPLVLISLVFTAWAAMFMAVRRRIGLGVFGGMLTDDIPNLDWAELAYLVIGPQGVFEAAAVWYVQNGYGEYEPKGSRLITVQSLAGEVHPAVRILQARLKPYFTAHRNGAEIAPAYDAHFRYLENRRLVVPGCVRFKRVAYPSLLVISSWLSCVCCIVICNHYFGNSPLLPGGPGFVVTVTSLACGVFLFLGSLSLWTWVVFTDRRLSRWGLRVLREHQRRQWPDRGFVQIFGPVPGTEHNLALAVALFGLLALRKTPLAHMMDGLSPPGDGSL
jgi:uncharacterized protein (TIGR04222 family)